MIRLSQYKGKRVGVLGLGMTGLAVAQSLNAAGSIPLCWDDNKMARETAINAGYEINDFKKLI